MIFWMNAAAISLYKNERAALGDTINISMSLIISGVIINIKL